MYLQDEERRPRSYDWSGKQARRQRFVRLALLAALICAAGLLAAAGYIPLHAG